MMSASTNASLKIETVKHTIAGTPLWVAYYPNGLRATGETEEDAIDSLLCIGQPDNLKFEHHRDLASDECPWTCHDVNYPGLMGTGASPGEAARDWEHRRDRTWHYRRLEELFLNFRRTAELALELSASGNKNAMSFHKREVDEFIRDWRQGKIGLKTRPGE